MREILFRGKAKYDNGSVKKGDWVYGDLIRVNGITKIYNDVLGYVEVNPETVGQFTGLSDKNGVRIFEGDILNTTNSNCAIWYVDYKNTAFCCNQGNANYSCVLDDFIQYSYVEVIGNVHGNTELLEVR